MPYREQIDKSRIPAHVAIIMDGNGRWAFVYLLSIWHVAIYFI